MREFCVAGTGHPSDFLFGWVANDERHLYVRLDFVGDNTRDNDKDYAEILVPVAAGIKRFKVSEADSRWGRASFAYTDKAPYQHKVYDFRIPFAAMGLHGRPAPGTALRLAFKAYGTLGAQLFVVDTNPTDSATGVPVDNAISVTFNMAVDPSTVDNSTYVVRRTSDGSPVSGSFSFASGDTVVTFTPSAPLEPLTSYTVTLPANSIRDATYETGLLEPYTFTFTTGGADNGVILFFRDTPGCAVTGQGGKRGGVGGAFAVALLPALLFLAARARKARRGDPSAGVRSTPIRVFLGAALLLVAATAEGGQLGAPQPAGGKGQLTLGAGYFHLEEKWKPDRASDLAGATRVEWATDLVRRNALFVQGAYGLSNRCEVFLRLGAADRRAPQGFKDSYVFFGSIGTRGVLYSRPKFSLGPVVQASFYGSNEDDIAFTQGASTWRGKEEIDGSWEVSAAVAAQAFVGKAILYAGPLFSWTRADVRYRITNGTTSLDVANTYKTKNPFGGYAGLRTALPAGLTLELEGQIKDRFSAGGTVSYAF